jgi:nucleoside-diphosphate-sugar epimerase
MNVLVTGVEGYIGSVLAPYLAAQGHSITGLDTGFYREGCLYHPESSNFTACINKDLRNITQEDLSGFDAVVHLAELSNDPLGQHNPAVTYSVNHVGSVSLAEKCRTAGIARFVYTSSCSVYGAGSGEYKSEQSETCPQTAYADCKLLVERDVSAMANDDFSPTFLRNATAYGASPRMRFDLVLNNLAGHAWTSNEIKMSSDGSPWRPLVHVSDIARAICCALEAPREVVHNEVFNVGSTSENYRVREIAQIVAETFPRCHLSIGKSDGDHRSYRVCFDKIHSRLPGFKCLYTATVGAQELLELFQRIDMSPDQFNFRAYTRLKQLHYLLSTGQIDEQLRWAAESGLDPNSLR